MDNYPNIKIYKEKGFDVYEIKKYFGVMLFSAMLFAGIIVFDSATTSTYAATTTSSTFTTTISSAVIVLDTSNNSTLETAYNWESYSDGKSTSTVMLPAGQDGAYFKFTVNSGDKIYARCSYDSDYEGMYIQLLDSTGQPVSKSVSPGNVVNPNSVIPFLAVNCEGAKSNQVFYIKVVRGSNYDKNERMYFTLSLNNRIKTGNGTFNFSGTTKNSGNTSLSSTGVNSSILKLDLSSNSNIPKGAIVTSVTTSSKQSPSQGNVHHMIMTAKPGKWYTSKVSSATSGSYNISNTDGISVAQVWQFKYNALATASSTMSNITISFNWKYDITENNYK